MLEAEGETKIVLIIAPQRACATLATPRVSRRWNWRSKRNRASWSYFSPFLVYLKLTQTSRIYNAQKQRIRRPRWPRPRSQWTRRKLGANTRDEDHWTHTNGDKPVKQWRTRLSRGFVWEVIRSFIRQLPRSIILSAYPSLAHSRQYCIDELGFSRRTGTYRISLMFQPVEVCEHLSPTSFLTLHDCSGGTYTLKSRSPLSGTMGVFVNSELGFKTHVTPGTFGKQAFPTLWKLLNIASL